MKPAILILVLLALAGCASQPRSYPHQRVRLNTASQATRDQIAVARADIDAAKEGVTFGGKRP